MSAPRLWSIGHSTREWDDFLALVKDAGIEAIADVRRFAASRRHPQFGGAALARGLSDAGIAYHPMPELGGRREPRADSINTAWKHPAYRGYADYMATPEFRRAFDRLSTLAHETRTAMMCAEADWHDCHRSLIADAFKARGWDVIHVREGRADEVHPYTRQARIVDGRLEYSKPNAAQGSLF